MQQMDQTKTSYHLPCINGIISFDISVERTRMSQKTSRKVFSVIKENTKEESSILKDLDVTQNFY